jgi:peptide deformylase
VENTELRAHVQTLLDQNPEGVLPLIQAGDPVLRVGTQQYDGQLGDLLPDLLHAMHLTMLDAPGVGVAAPQVNVPLAIAVMWDPGTDDPDDTRERVPFEYRVVINPRYEPVGDEKVSYFEGCLSVNGYQAVVARYRTVRFTGIDEHGDSFDEILTGWPARIAQHETDHLNGTLYIDKADIRSLTTTENLIAYWAFDCEPHTAGGILGFEVAQEPQV